MVRFCFAVAAGLVLACSAVSAEPYPPADQKRPLGREQRSTVLTRWSSARYRARAGWRRNCHAYAIGIPGMPRKFGGPDFARGAFQLEIISSMSTTDFWQIEAGDKHRSC